MLFGLNPFSASSFGSLVFNSTFVSATGSEAGTIAAGATSATVSVSNLVNTSNWQVMVIPGEGGTTSMYGGHNFTVNQGTGSFTVTNTGTAANFYNYFIVKSGDTDT